MWIATLGSSGFETGSDAIEGEPLGHCRFGWQGRTATNGTCAGLVQGACGCLAPPFGPAYTIWHPTIFVAVAPASAMDVEANSNRSSFCLATLRCKRRNGISDASRSLMKRSTID